MHEFYTFIEWAVRATLVLGAAGLLNVLFRNASASLRHLVWACALAGMLAMPVVSRVLPRWTAPLGGRLLSSPETALLSVEAKITETLASRTTAADQPAPAGRPRRTLSLPLVLLWLAGAAVVLLHAAAGWLFVLRLRRSAAPARPEVNAMATELAAAIGIARRPRVLETPLAAIPVTWGVFRPMIVVPTSVADRPEQLRVVLMHELAHVVRRDYLVHWIGQAACAFYWFHPLAWFAQRQAVRLRERAADDLVLRNGVRASEYAGHLMGLVRSLAAPRLCGSLAMAHRSNLEQRVKAILDGSTRRAGLNRTAVAAAAVLAGVFVTSIGSVGAVAAGQAPAAATADEQALVAAAKAAGARFGPQSLDYARALTKLGAFHRDEDRLPQAGAAYEASLPILERQLGAQSPELVEPLYVLGVTAHVKKDDALASQHYQRAVDLASLNRLSTGAALLARVGLAQIASHEGDFNRAAAVLEEGRAAPESSEKAVLLAALSAVLPKLGRDAEAEAAAGDANAMRERLGAPAPRLPADVLRIGGDVKAPRLLLKVDPEYTEEARALKVQGTTVLRVVIGTDGTASDIAVLRTAGIGLDRKAVEALRQWRFQPGTRSGTPVNVAATVEMNFRLL